MRPIVFGKAREDDQRVDESAEKQTKAELGVAILEEIAQDLGTVLSGGVSVSATIVTENATPPTLIIEPAITPSGCRADATRMSRICRFWKPGSNSRSSHSTTSARAAQTVHSEIGISQMLVSSRS